jgi:hypothetical protein
MIPSSAHISLVAEAMNLRLTVTDIIEDISLVNPSTPHANHVLIAINEELKPRSIAVGRDPIRELT